MDSGRRTEKKREDKSRSQSDIRYKQKCRNKINKHICQLEKTGADKPFRKREKISELILDQTENRCNIRKWRQSEWQKYLQRSTEASNSKC